MNVNKPFDPENVRIGITQADGTVKWIDDFTVDVSYTTVRPKPEPITYQLEWVEMPDGGDV